MATNKKESFVYNVILCGTMTYLMGVVNIFLENWPRSFCIAMFIQLIFAGPVSRKVLSLMFKRQPV